MKPSVLIELDRPRNLRMDTNALVKVEELLGRPISTFDENNTGIKEMRILLYAGLLHEDKILTLDMAGDLMDGRTAYVSTKINEALNLAFDSSGNDARKDSVAAKIEEALNRANESDPN